MTGHDHAEADQEDPITVPADTPIEDARMLCACGLPYGAHPVLASMGHGMPVLVRLCDGRQVLV